VTKDTNRAVRMDDIQNYNVQERLRDQRTVTIRAIRSDDKGLVTEALRDVSADSIYRRLFTTKRTITPEGLKKITEVDFVDVVALVAVLEKDGNDQIAGGGQYIRSGASGSGQKAEVAFLISDAFQGLGIASRIFKHLVTIARESGITQFEAEVLPSNEAMLRVFERAGIPLTRNATRDSVHVLMDLAKEASVGR
jgi:RimJ/RimL family protein N-acetyltransferase